MIKTKVASYSRLNGMLDDEYILFDNGDFENIYDANIFPGNQDLKRVLKAADLKKEIK